MRGYPSGSRQSLSDAGTKIGKPCHGNTSCSRNIVLLSVRHRSTHREPLTATQGKTLVASILAVSILSATASAQQAPSPPPTTPYGAPLGLEAAKKIMAAAEAEAVKNNWAMAIVILDSTGHMVMLHKLDNTQYGSLMAAEDKALSAINYRRPP